VDTFCAEAFQPQVIFSLFAAI